MSAPLRQAGATVTPVAAATSSTQLFAARAASQRLIYNDSTAVLYLKFGTAASVTSYTTQIQPGQLFEFPGGVYDDVAHGVWAAANGNAYCTEVGD